MSENQKPQNSSTPHWRAVQDFDLADGEWALLFLGLFPNGERCIEMGYREGGGWHCVDSQCGGIESCGEPDGWFPIPEGFSNHD